MDGQTDGWIESSWQGALDEPKFPPGLDPHLEIDDVGSYEDSDALQKIPNHMDEGRPDAGVLPLLSRLLMAVSVSVSRLMEGDAHSA